MTQQFGIWDDAQKAWTFIVNTIEEAEDFLHRQDSKTSAIHSVEDGLESPAPAAPEAGAPAAPQESVAVVSEAPAAA